MNKAEVRLLLLKKAFPESWEQLEQRRKDEE